MAKAAAKCFRVSMPFGDSRYDVGGGGGRKDSAGAGEVDDVSEAEDALVQSERDGPGRKLCEEGVVDFFAIYLIPIDTWYIIPSDWQDADQFALHAGGRRKTYERYREAWELLRTVSGRLYVGVSIESGDVSSNSIRFQQQSCDPCAPDIP